MFKYTISTSFQISLICGFLKFLEYKDPIWRIECKADMDLLTKSYKLINNPEDQSLEGENASRFDLALCRAATCLFLRDVIFDWPSLSVSGKLLHRLPHWSSGKVCTVPKHSKDISPQIFATCSQFPWPRLTCSFFWGTCPKKGAANVTESRWKAMAKASQPHVGSCLSEHFCVVVFRELVLSRSTVTLCMTRGAGTQCWLFFQFHDVRLKISHSRKKARHH